MYFILNTYDFIANHFRTKKKKKNDFLIWLTVFQKLTFTKRAMPASHS